MAQVIGHELEIYGSHGMQAWRYDAMLAMLGSGKVAPQRLIRKRIKLEDAIDPLVTMDRAEGLGMTVIEF
jgi:alcohol dehydrogenase